MEICSRVYYDKITGEVVCVTNEASGCYKSEPTKEEDFKRYKQLQDRNIDDYNYIKLQYGELSNILSAKSIKVKLPNKELEIEVFSQEEIKDMESNIEYDEVELPNSQLSEIDKLKVENERLTDLYIEQLALILELQS